MALKGDRFEGIQTIKYFMNEVAAPGGIACLSTAGSGAALDQSKNLVTYAASVSGAVPIGILLTEMVNVNQAQYHINFHKSQTQMGGVVPLLKEGWVTTNMIYPGTTPAGGQAAYVGHSGYITNVQDGGAYCIGEFESSKDEDGYCSLYVKLPATSRPVAAAGSLKLA